MKTQFTRLVIVMGVLTLGHPLMAQAPEGEGEAMQPEEVATELPSKFESDGTRILVDSLNVSLEPVPGWEVILDGPVSVIIQEPKVERPAGTPIDYSVPIFQKNITIAAIHEPSPIDDMRAKEIISKLQETYTGDGLVADFQILEHKFFDFKLKNDGLIIYTSMSLDKFEMMQMHIVVGGSKNQVMMSYTDLASDFSQPDRGFDAAWKSMTSIAIEGDAPWRYREMATYGVILGAVFVLFMLIGLLRKRAAKRMDLGGDEIDEPSTGVSGSTSWNLKDSKPYGDDDDADSSTF